MHLYLQMIIIEIIEVLWEYIRWEYFDTKFRHAIKPTNQSYSYDLIKWLSTKFPNMLTSGKVSLKEPVTIL